MSYQRCLQYDKSNMCIKEKYLSDAVYEYSKRISKYTKIEIIEVNDRDKFPINDILNKEAEDILKHIKDKDYVITLEINGNSLDSLELAKKVDNIFNNYSNLVFVIGGSYGISDIIKNRSNYSLSFSNLTFPHQLFRVMLLEQIYRVYKINNNETYHK